MMKSAEIYIVANGSLVRAFRKKLEDLSGNPKSFRLEEISVEPSLRVPSEEKPETSDRPGRFEGGNRAGVVNNLVHGDRNRADLEREKRHGLALAEAIERIITRQNLQTWCLVAPGPWISRVEERLSTAVRKKLIGSDAVDLTQHTLKDIEMRLISK